MKLISTLAAIFAIGTASTVALTTPSKSTPVVSKNQCFRKDELNFKYKGISFKCSWFEKQYIGCSNPKELITFSFYTKPGANTVKVFQDLNRPAHIETLKAFMHEYVAICNPGAQVKLTSLSGAHMWVDLPPDQNLTRDS